MTASTAECGRDVGWGTVDLSSIKSVDLQSLYGAELSFMSIMHPKFNIYWYHSNCRPNLSSSTPCMKGGEMKERKGEGWKRGTCSPPPSRRCCRFVSISRHGHRSIGRSVDLAISGVTVRLHVPWLLIQHNAFCIKYLDFPNLKVT